MDNLPDVLNNDVDVKVHLTRNEYIAYLHLIEGKSQGKVADMYGITKQRVSQLCSKYYKNETVQRHIAMMSEKKTSSIARSKALQIIESIDKSKIHDNSKATSAAILIDKARLLDGQTTDNVGIAISTVSYK